MRREPLVGDQLEVHLLVRLARALLDRTLNSVAIDRSLAGLLGRRRQPRVQVRVRAAQLGRDHDFADQLRRHLALLLRVCLAPGLFPLCAQVTSTPAVVVCYVSDSLQFGAALVNCLEFEAGRSKNV